MKMTKHNARVRAVAVTAVFGALVAMTGCAVTSNNANTGPIAMVGPQLHGIAFGGRQPIAGATLSLYAASSNGYGAATTNLLPAGTVTRADGTFGITGAYTCSAGQQMYLVALGGNPGAGTNPQSGIMAALGDCAGLSNSTYINMNEVTTVGSVFALAPFMSGYAGIGATAANNAGLLRAFVNVNKMVNIGTGVAGGPLLAAGATVPTAEINTLANVLASCVNTTGGYAGDPGTPCGNLFYYATPSGGVAPTNTIDLAMRIAQNPALNTANEFAYSTAVSAYKPALSTAPNDWTMSIVYTGAFNAPTSVTLDANGKVWVANSGSNTVQTLAQTGSAAQLLSGNGLITPSAVAIDSAGNAFVANKGGTAVSAFTANGGIFTGSPFTVSTAPVALAFDAAGNLFIANNGSNSITELNSAGALVRTITAGITAPTAIVIDPK